MLCGLKTSLWGALLCSLIAYLQLVIIFYCDKTVKECAQLIGAFGLTLSKLHAYSLCVA
jgi:hypothetical protein